MKASKERICLTVNERSTCGRNAVVHIIGNAQVMST